MRELHLKNGTIFKITKEEAKEICKKLHELTVLGYTEILKEGFVTILQEGNTDNYELSVRLSEIALIR